MWVTTQFFLPPPIPFTIFSKLPQPSITTSSTLQLRRINPHPPLITGGLGQAVFSALESSPTSGPNPTNKAQPRQGNEISGSDILRALQKASAKKANSKKQNNKKRSNELNKKNNGGKGVEFEKVRPITIKSDWVTRLADLEKRLQEFHVH